MMETLGKVTFGVIVLVIGAIVNAFVIQKLWQWILMPVLDLPDITLSAAFGLSIVAGFLRSGTQSKKRKGTMISQLTEALVNVLVNAGFYLLLGWVASWVI